jgi:tetratricopeptide (TPR) repeat protein
MSGRVVLTLLATCFSAGLCSAQNSDPFQDIDGHRGLMQNTRLANISGVVSGSDGAPIPDARIDIREEQTGRTIASGYTNNSGGFAFSNLPAAAYDVVASRGLSESRERLSLSDVGANLRIRLNTSNAAAAQADGNATVSIAEYKVPQKARDALHRAQIALTKSRREEAEKQLAKALEIYPEYAAALTLHGVLSLDQDKTQTAVDDFDKAIHSDPSFALAYTGMAAAMNQLKKFDEALRSADRAVTLAPRAWQTYFEMAKAYVGKADYPTALKQLIKAQEFVPTDYAPIHLVRAHALMAIQNYNDAVNELQAFLSLAPQDPNAGLARQALEKVKAFTAAAPKPPVASAIR